MLKGSREATLLAVRPVSVHGQVSLDLEFTWADEPGAAPQLARLGPEAIAGDPRPGDRIRVAFLFGVVTGVTRVP